MRKLKLQMQISIDGSPQFGIIDEQKWVTWAWHEIRNEVLELADSCDTELIGRKLAVDYIPYWAEALLQPASPMHEVALIKARQRKIVFTKTLNSSFWPDVDLANGELVEEITKLKKQTGKDIIVYGGTSFVSELIEQGLIDEFYFFVNPVALGENGISLFSGMKSFIPLALKKCIPYPSGIVLLNYELKK